MIYMNKKGSTGKNIMFVLISIAIFLIMWALCSHATLVAESCPDNMEFISGLSKFDSCLDSNGTINKIYVKCTGAFWWEECNAQFVRDEG